MFDITTTYQQVDDHDLSLRSVQNIRADSTFSNYLKR